MIPEAARQSIDPDEHHHTGRGGAGNEQVESEKEEIVEKKTSSAPVGLADKLKAKLFGKK